MSQSKNYWTNWTEWTNTLGHPLLQPPERSLESYLPPDADDPIRARILSANSLRSSSGVSQTM